MYNEVKFWNNKENPIPKRELTDKEINLIVSFIAQFISPGCSVLDFGPGKGRTFAAYKGVSRLEAYDITDKWINDIKIQIKKNKIQNFNFYKANKIEKLPYDDNEFDVVVASLVLLHQRPQYIIDIMRELARVGKIVVVVSYSNPNKPFLVPGLPLTKSKRRKHNYNYKHLCVENNWKYKEYKHRPDGWNHIYFTYSKLE